jgi:hypothetical protein
MNKEKLLANKVMNNIILQENLTKAALKPIIGEFQTESDISYVFGIERGILHFVHAFVVDLEINSQSEKLFELRDNTITLCKLEKYDSNETKYWYSIRSKITSYGYKSTENPEWIIEFLRHDGEILHSDILNKYFKNNNFVINCEYNDYPIDIHVDLRECTWYDTWQQRSQANWKFKGGSMTKC